jgi:hypothetical protein
MSIVLETDVARAVILPESGGRVQHLVDRRTERELLYVRPAGEQADFASATTGGWDLLFPNDEAWRGHPDHGRVWNAAFMVEEMDRGACRLSTALDAPAAHVTRSFTMLDPPRAGLREEVRIHAEAELGPCLIAPHPALAADVGWRIELPREVAEVSADRDYPGRFLPGQALGHHESAEALTVPGIQPALVEVLYVEAVSEGRIASPDGSSCTLVRWDARSLPHLWICTLVGIYQDGPPAMVLLEPATSRPYRLDEAIGAGRFTSLTTGETWQTTVEVESLDH